MVASAEHDSDFWPSLYAQLRGTELDSREWFSPLASAVATEVEYLIRVEVPGVSGNNITIKIQQDSVVIEGTKVDPEHGGSAVVFFNERLYGHFVRTFKLPVDADLAACTSEVVLGVLLIHVPRRAAVDVEGIHPEIVD